MANNHNPNTRLTSVNRRAADEFQYKSHSEDGIHFHTGTGAATEGTYYGFLVVNEAVISDITYIDTTKQSGDITAITSFPSGFYMTIPGGFSTLTLTSGDVVLLKYVNKQ